MAVDDGPVEALTLDTRDEIGLVELAANALRLVRYDGKIVGFNVAGFDLRVLARRALLLGVPWPNLELGRYRYDKRIVDLQAVLSFGDGPQKGKTLSWYMRLFSLDDGAEDTVRGADIGALVKAGAWDAVAGHVRCDVERTRALARRLKIVA